VPLWVGLEGERIAVRMSQRTRKARNVARDLWVAISVTDRNQPHTATVVRGTSAKPHSPRGVRTPRRNVSGVCRIEAAAFVAGVRGGPMGPPHDQPRPPTKEKGTTNMKLTAITMVTVDGVMQGLGGPDEDGRGPFERGGWVAPFSITRPGPF
jgi:hypothetical protein